MALKLVPSSAVWAEHVDTERINPDFLRVEGPFLVALDAQPSIHDGLRRSTKQDMNDRTNPVESNVREMNTKGVAHELWAAAQLTPGERIEDGTRRIAAILSLAPVQAAEPVAIPAGWKIVPNTPTGVMKDSGHWALPVGTGGP
ncbi:TPA: hypothetical protein QDB26_006108 [Burkholderia vietnamiensis]|uniref:hypothetical protein n=1 Tax=Burkholderia vietnamiensis TaxID=60552 RepID=UPI0012D918E4|nr:hypothetical protein [Burkholderia vietnamiensis]HDR8929782.1 hypothetical protein [Burkholderia vietnamiensis]HDR9204959.1 hypothetical protein [Burkholderia vietnamiensis]HDR9217290.1 hypothetical protein [Burkholderia vietnamiensis]